MITSLWQKLTHTMSRLGPDGDAGELGDFTMNARIFVISFLALMIGAISAFVALILLRLIALFTNLFFFQRWSFTTVSPAKNTLGLLEILVPVIGALIIGVMARYGSQKIRGHGIPEAIESILMNGSKIEPKVAVLKPISSAISIGSGGPFGAEGPIIMTGGAFGSLIAQFFHLTSTERKILLVAGAAGGMSAVFNTPLAAILLAVELLLFEWKPRSLIPVALSSIMAALLRQYLIGQGPMFPVPAHVAFVGPLGLLSCILVGLCAGVLACIVTLAVYGAEDAFHKLPIHWMWWPAIGGVVVGIGGLVFPQALGVGYDVIQRILQGNVPLTLLVGILVVKAIIWSISLGSGTSGGVVAPLLMMGSALGGILGLFLPNEGPGFWAMICMAALLGGTMRAPLMGIVFTIELTHDYSAILPLVVAVMIAHGFTVLVMRRSILTEKISRRGYHLSQEYAIDPLEILLVREVMRTNIAALPAEITPQELKALLKTSDKADNHNDNHNIRELQTPTEALRSSDNNGKESVETAAGRQHLYPVVDQDERLLGVVTRFDLQMLIQEGTYAQDHPLAHLIHSKPVIAYPDEPLRAVVHRMADTGFTRLPVVERADPHTLVGIVSLQDLLKARTRNLAEERKRERVLRIRLLFPTRTERQESKIGA